MHVAICKTITNNDKNSTMQARQFSEKIEEEEGGNAYGIWGTERDATIRNSGSAHVSSTSRIPSKKKASLAHTQKSKVGNIKSAPVPNTFAGLRLKVG